MSSRLIFANASGTARILTPFGLRFSPSLGLLLCSHGSHLIANSRKFKLFWADIKDSNHNLAEVTKELFHQREDVKNGRFYGPISPTKLKSLPASWLTTSQIGSILGWIVSELYQKGKITDNDTDKFLRNIGIESNYVNNKWSGVSLARFRKLIKMIGKEYSFLRNHNLIFSTNLYFLPIISAFVWSKAINKKCILDFFLSFEMSSNIKIIREEYNDLRIENSLMQQEWLSQSFTAEDLSKENIVNIMNNSCWFDENDKKTIIDISNYSNSFSESIELMAASVANERSVQQGIKLGRYAYLDGKPKPDCVEVVLREIIESIIYDPSIQMVNPDFLPNTVLESVRKLYQTQYIINNYDSDFLKSSELSNSFGQEWFNICSQLGNGCEYLSITPKGKPYELRPTLRNICKALGLLLEGSQTWNTLHHLRNFLIKNNNNSLLFEVDEKIVSFRAPFSDTEMIHREIGIIRYLDLNRELVIELEDSHGLASMRHNIINSFGMAWTGQPLYNTFWNHWLIRNQIVVASNNNKMDDSNNYDQNHNMLLSYSMMIQVMHSTLFNDQMLKHWKFVYKAPLNTTQALSNLCLCSNILLSTRWAEERNSLPRNDVSGNLISRPGGNQAEDLRRVE
eukprot:gene12893-17277_t